jgi:hypothetical protein
MERILNIIQAMYRYELEVRFAFKFDIEYSWFLIDPSKKSRLTRDLFKTVAEQMSAEDQVMNFHFLSDPTGKDIFGLLVEKDWIASGNQQTFPECVEDAARTICSIYPNHDFSKWFLKNE